MNEIILSFIFLNLLYELRWYTANNSSWFYILHNYSKRILSAINLENFLNCVFFALKFEMYRFCKLFPFLKSLNMAEVGHPPVDVFKIEHLCSSKDFVQLLV